MFLSLTQGLKLYVLMQGHTAVRMSQQSKQNIFQVSLGNLPAGEDAEIKIEYIRLLQQTGNILEYVHTATWVPPYYSWRGKKYEVIFKTCSCHLLLDTKDYNSAPPQLCLNYDNSIAEKRQPFIMRHMNASGCLLRSCQYANTFLSFKKLDRLAHRPDLRHCDSNNV